ncbi:hypothetical protein LCGC14_2348320 [marine sediment metagenome]|uniref:Endonuclease/exonuclease/phosphatase family protein n=2 Tax=root TaxID=1 RepID=A0A831VUI7_9FLAO|nr:endonuclease/exonuclease/phosphatase family protein [Pricia antarctica]
MRQIRKTFISILYTIAIVLAVCSILSLFRNAEIRYIKMLDFPRIQLFILSLISFILLLIVIKKWRWYNYLLLFGLFSGLCINSTFLIHYTRLVSVEVPTAEDIKSSDNQLSILLFNVKMTNRKPEPLLDLIDQKNPDMILAMEVDDTWNKELKVLDKDYPYAQHTINEVTYGMVLYSKFPLEKVEVDYLTNKKVPSFESTISLGNDMKISFHAIHPVPPTHFNNLPDNAGQEENALKKLGKEIEKRKLPTIVAGDLNDVVWSYVDALTGTKNMLNDLRVGRGFFNSYNAENFLMRWPLDHVFVTKEFRLKKFERLPKIGSDHFPMYVELVL